jgi:hypothetical protein
MRRGLASLSNGRHDALAFWCARTIGPNSVISDYLRMGLAWHESFATLAQTTRPYGLFEPLDSQIPLERLAIRNLDRLALTTREIPPEHSATLGFRHRHLREDFDLGGQFLLLLCLCFRVVG